jgi:uncharacterized protein
VSRGEQVATLIDTNLLIYAFRPDRPEHDAARSWLLEQLTNGRVALTRSAVLGFLRVVTHPRVFEHPSSIGEALDFVSAMEDEPGCDSIEPGGGHQSLFEGFCRTLGLQGNEIPDAHLAAVAVEHGSVLATHDRGFECFAGLRTFDPLANS